MVSFLVCVFQLHLCASTYTLGNKPTIHLLAQINVPMQLCDIFVCSVL